MLFPIPMEIAHAGRRTYPSVVWCLLAANALAYLLLSPWTWGVGPGSGPLTVLTYGFVHVGLLHLVFNMWFLWVFGGPVSRRIGSGWFLALYLGTLVAIGLVARLFSPGYVVGSSGAVFAVVAVASMLMPVARVRVHYLAIFPLTVLIGLFTKPRYPLFWIVRWDTVTLAVFVLGLLFLGLEMIGLVAALFWGVLDWTNLVHLLGFGCGVGAVLMMPARITMAYRTSLT